MAVMGHDGDYNRDEFEEPQPPAKPERHDQPWTLEEEQKLVYLFSQGKTPGDIAREHKRTVNAITTRLVVCNILFQDPYRKAHYQISSKPWMTFRGLTE